MLGAVLSVFLFVFVLFPFFFFFFVGAVRLRYQGSVNKFLVDDKGTTMLLCFGLPPVVHEDDAARAVLASLLICWKLKAGPPPCPVVVVVAAAAAAAVANKESREAVVKARFFPNCTLDSMEWGSHSVLCVCVELNRERFGGGRILCPSRRFFLLFFFCARSRIAPSAGGCTLY